MDDSPPLRSARPRPGAVLTGERLPFPGWRGLVSVVALSALAVLAFRGLAPVLDVPAFRWMNRASLATGGAPWACLGLLGEGTVLLGAVALLVARRPQYLWPFLLATLCLVVTLLPAKALLDAHRPIAVLGDEVIVVGKRLGKESFPSGHTAVAFLAAHVLWCGTRRRRVRALVVVLALACGISRVVVGAHWPSDVLGGLALGWLAGGLGVRLSARLPVVEGRATHVLAPLFFSGASLALALYRRDLVSAVRDGIGVLAVGLAALVIVRHLVRAHDRATGTGGSRPLAGDGRR